MITKFNEYIKEALTDKMIPKDEEEIIKKINDKEGIDKLKYIKRYNLYKYFTEKELQDIYDNLAVMDIIDLAIEDEDYDEIKNVIKDNYHRKNEIIHDFDMLPLYAKMSKAYDISTVAVQWNNDAFDDLVEELFGHDVFSGKKGDLNVSEILDELSDKELVILYGVLIDKINELPND